MVTLSMAHVCRRPLPPIVESRTLGMQALFVDSMQRCRDLRVSYPLFLCTKQWYTSKNDGDERIMPRGREGEWIIIGRSVTILLWFGRYRYRIFLTIPTVVAYSCKYRGVQRHRTFITAFCLPSAASNGIPVRVAWICCSILVREKNMSCVLAVSLLNHDYCAARGKIHVHLVRTGIPYHTGLFRPEYMSWFHRVRSKRMLVFWSSPHGRESSKPGSTGGGRRGSTPCWLRPWVSGEVGMSMSLLLSRLRYRKDVLFGFLRISEDVLLSRIVPKGVRADEIKKVGSIVGNVSQKKEN